MSNFESQQNAGPRQPKRSQEGIGPYTLWSLPSVSLPQPQCFQQGISPLQPHLSPQSTSLTQAQQLQGNGPTQPQQLQGIVPTKPQLPQAASPTPPPRLKRACAKQRQWSSEAAFTPPKQSQGTSCNPLPESQGTCPTSPPHSKKASSKQPQGSQGTSPIPPPRSKRANFKQRQQSQGTIPLQPKQSQGISPQPTQKSQGASPTPSSPTPSRQSQETSHQPTQQSQGASPTPSRLSQETSPILPRQSQGIISTTPKQSQGTSPTPSQQSQDTSPTQPQQSQSKSPTSPQQSQIVSPTPPQHSQETSTTSSQQSQSKSPTSHQMSRGDRHAQHQWSQGSIVPYTQQKSSQDPNVIQLKTSQQGARPIQPNLSKRQKAQVKAAENTWRQCIHDWYPKLHSRTYFLPPLYFNKVSYDVKTVADQSVLVPQMAPNQASHTSVAFVPISPHAQAPGSHLASRVWPDQQIPSGPLPRVQDSDIRDGHAMQQVLHYIRGLAKREKEVMLVLSQLEFRKYLDNHVDPITAAAIRLLPRSSTLISGSQSVRQTKNMTCKQARKLASQNAFGEFDVLMISAQYGLIVGEVKAIGCDLSKTPHLDHVLVKVISKAVKQLNKAEEMLRHLVSDMSPVRITKTLMLPNITTIQLLQALSTNLQVQQALCECVSVSDKDPFTTVSHCYCLDSEQSNSWWQRTVTDQGSDVYMSHDKYERLVARFCGPATTIEIPTLTTPRRSVKLRTLSEAVALTGLTMAMLTLYPLQIDLVNRPRLPRVFLWGPPGTGKTVILVIKGSQWGRQGKDIHLLSSHRYSRAAILLIKDQLLHTPGIKFTAEAEPSPRSAGTANPASSPRVYTHFYDFNKIENVQLAVEELALATCNKEIFIIADEAFRDSQSDTANCRGRFAEFCTQLAARVPALHLWAAAVERDITADCMCEVQVTTPLRCPPAIVQEVAKSQWLDDHDIPRYTSSGVPSPTDGPEIIRLYHRQSPDHDTPLSGHAGRRPEDCECCGDVITDLILEIGVGQPGKDLQYRDTFILCGNPHDNLPVVTSLKTRGLPVQAVTKHDDEAVIHEVALAMRDAVTVTDSWVVSGLERRVVVVMGWGDVDYTDRLYAMSRCTALLVWLN